MAKFIKHNCYVGIVGAGSIGVAWAVVFATRGYPVRLYEVATDRILHAKDEFLSKISELKKFGLIENDIDAIAPLLSIDTDLESITDKAIHIQECIPEIKEDKKKLFALLSELTPPDVPIASSTSFLPASTFASDVSHRERCLVIHPGNPPYLLRIAEIVPAPFTSMSVVEKSKQLMIDVQMHPIVLSHETTGFVFNRLQGALLNEAYSLVDDGIVSIEGIDLIVRDALGLRWSVLGPFETVDLNTRGGIKQHAARMGPTYEKIGAERGTNTSWGVELVDKVAAARRAKLPLEKWEERVSWRDRAMMTLIIARRKFLGQD